MKYVEFFSRVKYEVCRVLH